MDVFWSDANRTDLFNCCFFTLLLSLIFSNRLIFFGLLIGEFALVIVLSKNALKYSYGKTVGLFLFYSFLNGLTLSSILLLYTGQSIATAFMIASVVFGVMALYGYVTKTDLTPFRSFLMVGVIGIIVLTVINIFLGNGTLFYLINLAGVVIFAGLTAYDLQKMKSLYAYSVNNTQVASGNIAVTGALTLYLDFINLFLLSYACPVSKDSLLLSFFIYIFHYTPFKAI